MSADDFITAATKRRAKRAEVKEIDIEKAFCRYADKLGCKALKLIFLNKKGFPDRTIICRGGMVFFIEFKSKGKKPSPPQIIVRKMLESFGFEYHVCDAKGQAESHLDDFLAQVKQPNS